MDHSRIHYLLHQQAAGHLTSEEWSELEMLVGSSGHLEAFEEVFKQVMKTTGPDLGGDSAKWKPVLEKIVTVDKREIMVAPAAALAPVHRIHFLKTAWFRYAAVLLLIAGISTFVYLNIQPKKQEIVKKQPLTQPDIAPGGNKATLTLSDGSTIILDSAANGSLASQGNVRILKLDAGKLAYEGKGDTERLFNTITTPRGGQYQIVLPDGSRVWLNAASSVRFPTTFAGTERKVEVTGEAYFEIAKDPKMPFRVSVDHQADIEVLGTSFNVNAYEDEMQLKTTLLEGSISIEGATYKVILKPGEQALLALRNNTAGTASQKGNNIAIRKVSGQEATAWKDGYFYFNNASIEEVMRQLARWYDVDIKFDGQLPDNQFLGKMFRNTPVSQVLEILALGGGVQFTIDGKAIKVKKALKK